MSRIDWGCLTGTLMRGILPTDCSVQVFLLSQCCQKNLNEVFIILIKKIDKINR